MEHAPDTHVRDGSGCSPPLIRTGAPRPSSRCRVYDFNWQIDYVFKQPLKLPKGTKIGPCVHDNSVANKGNPDLTVDVPGRSDVAGNAVHRVRLHDRSAAGDDGGWGSQSKPP